MPSTEDIHSICMSPFNKLPTRGCPSMELRVPSTDSNPSGQAKEALSRRSTRGSH
jgi:hypothetical protein